jgi:hypothetical protein
VLGYWPSLTLKAGTDSTRSDSYYNLLCNFNVTLIPDTIPIDFLSNERAPSGKRTSSHKEIRASRPQRMAWQCPSQVVDMYGVEVLEHVASEGHRQKPGHGVVKDVWQRWNADRDPSRDHRKFIKDP